ncbi:hypothetical protein KI387_002786, partial [Taxus chinensis]
MFSIFLRHKFTVSKIQRYPNARFPCCRSITHDSNVRSARVSTPVNTLLTKLVNSRNRDIKCVLDQEQDLFLRSDALFWEPLLRALKSAVSSSSNMVHQVLEWKIEKLVKESNRDPRDWARQISLAGRVNNTQLASRAFSLMELQQIRPTSTVFNSLIYAYGFSNRLAKALSLFEVMERTEDCQPTLVTYNTFMSVYSRLGDANNLQAWYEACKNAGFSPNADTYKHLILGFLRANRYDRMNFAFREMISSGVMPNIATLESVMEGYCKQGRLERMKETLKFMKEEGWNVTEKIATRVFEVYAKLGEVREMQEMLVIGKALQNTKFVSEVYSKIVKAYALSGQLDDMEFYVGKMLEDGANFSCSGDVEAVISSYFFHEAYDRLEFFLNQVTGVCKLSSGTYNLLFTEYEKAGQIEKLQVIVENIKKAGFNPSSDISQNLQYFEQMAK